MGESSPNAFRILVVDDEPGFRELCVDLLADSGYAVDDVENGQEAMEQLAERPYQLALSDINMPVMDGLVFLKNAKIRFPQLEIILMTAFGGLQSALEALRNGAYDYITKPFTRDLLLATVRRCLEKQRLEAELKEVQGKLIQKEKLAALGSVSGWLAHRMRNPLNVILMCSQYLKTKFPEDDDRRNVSAVIEDKVQTLERMTKDFIGFSRTYEPRLHPEDVHDLVNRVLETRAAGPFFRNVKVEKRYEDPFPPVLIDKDLIEEVLGYLVDNAIEAMNGEGTLTVKVSKTPDMLVLDISNTGAAIPPEARARLFEPFFTTKERGTGLGLAIARRVMESHGGDISLLDGEPTVFRLRLPLPPAAPA